MRSTRFSRRVFARSAIFALGAVGATGRRARAAQFEFKCGSDLAGDHPSVIGLTQMFAAIEQESGGRIHTQVFPNSTLGGTSAMFSQLREGALAFNLINPGALATVVPIGDICYLGFAFKDSDEGMRVMAGPLGDYVREQSLAKNVFTLKTLWDSGMLQIGGQRAIRTPDDLHGFRIRVPESKISIDLFKTLGASPTPISQSEVYTSLQTKLIDGQQSPLVTLYTAKFYEVEKFVTLTNHGFSGNWLVANGEVWRSLPADLQALIERNNTTFALAGHATTKTMTASLSGRLKEQGMTIVPVDQAPFRARLKPYFETWATTFGPTAWGLLERSLGHKLT